MAEPTSTVGETRTLLGALLGVGREHVEHYAVVAQAPEGLLISFCCDDRAETANLLARAGEAILTGPGTSRRSDGRRPPMPGEVPGG